MLLHLNARLSCFFLWWPDAAFGYIVRSRWYLKDKTRWLQVPSLPLPMPSSPCKEMRTGNDEGRIWRQQRARRFSQSLTRHAHFKRKIGCIIHAIFVRTLETSTYSKMRLSGWRWGANRSIGWVANAVCIASIFYNRISHCGAFCTSQRRHVYNVQMTHRKLAWPKFIHHPALASSASLRTFPMSQSTFPDDPRSLLSQSLLSRRSSLLPQ